MTNYQTIEIERNSHIGTIWLNRPEKRNAFNEEMIKDLIDSLFELEEDDNIRVIVFRGKGKSFCAGADLNWMRNVKDYTYKQNFRESKKLAKLFFAIYNSPKPTICAAHGAVMGGANGLLAASDIAYATEDTIFAFSEVKIGIVPATISPYIVKRIGEFPAKELMLTGRRFTADEALKYQLVNAIFTPEALEQKIQETTQHLISSGPKAMAICKTLLYDIQNRFTLCESINYTSQIIADIRASDEGQEGIASFLDKRKPAWEQ